MTGEITLSGLVFPVGGIKEKVLAAHRAGIRRIVLPDRNESDVEEIPEDVRKELEIVTAARIGDVLSATLEATSGLAADENYILAQGESASDGTGERLIAHKK
jgi:ATP-dependent Lon protease